MSIENALILMLTFGGSLACLLSLYALDTLKLVNKLNEQALKRLEEVEKELDKALTPK